MKTNPVLNKGVTTYNTPQNNPSRVLSLSDKAKLKRSIYVMERRGSGRNGSGVNRERLKD